MNLHINQRSLLAEKIDKHFPNTFDQAFEKVKELTYEKYQHLLAMSYNGEINKLRMELIKLGVSIGTS